MEEVRGSENCCKFFFLCHLHCQPGYWPWWDQWATSHRPSSAGSQHQGSVCQWDGLGMNAFHKATSNLGRISWYKLISHPPNPLARNRRNELTWLVGHYHVFCAASLCYSRPERTWGWSRDSLLHHIYSRNSRSPAPPRQSGYSRPCKTKVQKRKEMIKWAPWSYFTVF